MIDRYTLSKMGRIWSEQRKLEIMLQIEIFACEAMCNLGKIPNLPLKRSKRTLNSILTRSNASKSVPSMMLSRSSRTSARTLGLKLNTCTSA